MSKKLLVIIFEWIEDISELVKISYKILMKIVTKDILLNCLCSMS